MAVATSFRRPVEPSPLVSSPRTALERTAGLPVAPRPVPEKSLGQFAELSTHYDGSSRPARMGLRRVLDTGKMRNPLQMQQSAAAYSARRPMSAESSGSRPSSRAQSAGRERGKGPDRLGPAIGGSVPSGKAVDRGPAMLWPQRIELPGYLNTPQRKVDGEPLAADERMQALRRLQDLEHLTFACRRASKVREEGRAHFSIGVLRDNLGQFRKAIEAYQQFLRVCKECNDGQGCALAYHCIAVDYQLLGGSSDDEAVAGVAPGAASQGGAGSQARTFGSRESSSVRSGLLKKSIFYHDRHRESADSVGKFVAHLNMGLAYALLGEQEASTVNHQYALRYALQLHSLEGQSLAIGSLGFSAGMYDKDPEKLRILIERYVELSSTLKQPRNQAAAFEKLGTLAAQQGDNKKSIAFYQQAIENARAQGDRGVETDCSVRLGIAAGQADMAEHIANILKESVVQGAS